MFGSRKRQVRYESGRQAPAIVLVDTVLEALDAGLGVPHPERGGALMGPEGRELITHFVEDPTARVTQASYEASDDLMRRVAETEDGSILRWRGIAHSHPGRMADLSGPDLERLHESLVVNPWLPWVHAPIVVRRAPRDDVTTVRLQHGWLCWHTARLLRGGSLVVESRRAVVLPIGADLNGLADYFGGQLSHMVTDPGTGVAGVGGRIDVPDEGEILVLVGDHYPLTAPLVLWTPLGGRTMALVLRWSVSWQNRLVTAVRYALLDAGIYLKPAEPPSDAAARRPADAEAASAEAAG